MYVRRFPESQEYWQVSVSGGALPRWSGRGDELFFVWENALYVSQVTLGTQFRASIPKRLFEGGPIGVELFSFSPIIPSYDVSPDGQKIIAVRRVGAGPSTVDLIQNWRARLAR